MWKTRTRKQTYHSMTSLLRMRRTWTKMQSCQGVWRPYGAAMAQELP